MGRRQELKADDHEKGEVTKEIISGVKEEAREKKEGKRV